MMWITWLVYCGLLRTGMLWDVILEPGAAFVWYAGTLVSSVLDIVENKGVLTAMLDASFKAHMPDTLEMPYRPDIQGATQPVDGSPVYRMGGLSCLSGDFVGDYSFPQPLQIGSRIFFEDMLHYTLVQTTMFNGVRHPDVLMQRENGTLELLKRFDYDDYKARLG